MATVPCTIIVIIEDRYNLPIKAAYVVIKEIFQYGVKNIAIRGPDRIHISLSYSPKKITLERKFGNLPVRFMRTQLETDEEMMIFERAIKKFTFNVGEDEAEILEQLEAAKPKRTKLCLRSPSSEDIFKDIINLTDDEEEEEKGRSAAAATATCANAADDDDDDITIIQDISFKPSGVKKCFPHGKKRKASPPEEEESQAFF